MTERAPTEAEVSEAYTLIDRFLRNNLDDTDYATFSDALETVSTPPKSSFQHWVDEQEGNGPDAPSVGGNDPEAAIPAGWVFCTADFSTLAVGSGTEGRVLLRRDKAGSAAWHQLSDEKRETTRLYVSGEGKTIAEAIRAAALSASQEGAEG